MAEKHGGAQAQGTELTAQEIDSETQRMDSKTRGMKAKTQRVKAKVAESSTVFFALNQHHQTANLHLDMENHLSFPVNKQANRQIQKRTNNSTDKK